MLNEHLCVYSPLQFKRQQKLRVPNEILCLSAQCSLFTLRQNALVDFSWFRFVSVGLCVCARVFSLSFHSPLRAFIDSNLIFRRAHFLIAMHANYALIRDSVGTHSLLLCSVSVCVRSSGSIEWRVVRHRQREVITLVAVQAPLSHSSDF